MTRPEATLPTDKSSVFDCGKILSVTNLNNSLDYEFRGREVRISPGAPGKFNNLTISCFRRPLP